MQMLMINTEEDLKEEYLLDTEYLINEDELQPFTELEEIKTEYEEVRNYFETYGHDCHTAETIQSLFEKLMSYAETLEYSVA